MTNVSFYKLAGNQQVALALACQLIQKSLQAQQQVLCLVPDHATAQQLDEQLWSFQDTAFVPHAIGIDNAPVAISVDPEPGDHHQILINLQAQIPTWFSRFDRVMEIIYAEPSYEQAKRENFKFYQQRGYALSFHDLSETFNP